MMWSIETTRRFWESNKAKFAGDTIAPEVLRLSRKYIGPRVLDIGAGSGALIDQIPYALGIDIVPRHARIAQGTVAALPFPDAVFDIVFAVDILEHLDDRVLASGMNEIRRVLQPGGNLIVVVPYKEDMSQNIVCCPACQAEFHRWGHVRVFDEQSVTRLLLGFHTVKMSVMPLSLMAEHWIIRRFWWLFLATKFCRPSDLLVVARKCQALR